MRTVITVFALLASLVLWGCRDRARVTAPPSARANAADSNPPPVAVTPPLPNPAAKSVTVPIPAPTSAATALSSFDKARDSFEAGKFPEAALSFEAYLSSNPEARNRDSALFYLGMARALSVDANRDLSAFRLLLSEFPDSSYRKQAEFILGLQVEIDRLKADLRETEERTRRLSDELHKLKEIDMQRRPSRPPD